MGDYVLDCVMGLLLEGHQSEGWEGRRDKRADLLSRADGRSWTRALDRRGKPIESWRETTVDQPSPA